MNGIIIEVEGYPKTTEPSSDNQEVESPLLQKMKLAYVDFFQNEYEPKLPKNGNNEAIYPQFSVTIDEETNEIVFDSDLFEQLCEIYIIEGWDGIIEVEKKVEKINEEIKKNDPRILSGGIPNIKWDKDVFPKVVNSWNLAIIFFTFIQKMLALLIRETLANIEKLSAEQIIAKLSITNVESAKAFDKYKIDYTTPKEDSQNTGSSKQRPDTKAYVIGELSLATDLYKSLTDAVNEKYKFDEVEKKLLGIQISRKTTERSQPYAAEEIEKLKKMEKEVGDLKSASENLLKTLQNLLKKKHPLGLLIYSSLKKDFKQPEMENLFGLTITKLREEIESLGIKIDPQISQVELLLPFKQTGDIRRDISNFNIPKGNPEKGEKGGLENFVLNTSLAKYQDSIFFPLLAEENLNQLFDKEIIQADSFENVVGFHYLSALIKKLGEIEKAEKEWEDFWKKISKISSALSLATLVTPATAEIAPLLRGGAAIADLALLAYTVSSVTGSLKRNDELMKKTLVNQEDYSTDSLAQIGDVISMRKEFQENLSEQLAIEIFNITVGGKLPVFKEFLLARGYYYDIETLFETEDQPE